MLLCMDEMKILTDNITRLMVERGKTSQVKLAAAAGISQTNLSNIMRHAVYPQLSTVISIAAALRVQTWELLAPAGPRQINRLLGRLSPEDQDAVLRIVDSFARRQ